MNREIPYFREEVFKARTKRDIEKIYPSVKFFKETKDKILGELDYGTYAVISRNKLNIKVERVLFGIGGPKIENPQ